MKKLNKMISILITVAMLITSMGMMATVMAADGATIPLSGDYTFLNIAYSPDSDIYVAAAKNLSELTTPMKLLASKNGYAWTETKSFDSAVKEQTKKARQVLTYWDEQKIFVAIVGGQLWKSSDGLTWTELANGINGVITDNGNELVIAGANKMRIFSSLSEYADAEYNNYIYSGYVAAKENLYFGSAVQATSTAYAYSFVKTVDSETGADVYTKSTYYPANVDATTSVAYLPTSNRHIMAVNTTKYRSLNPNPSGEIAVKLSETEENTSVITAVGYANEKTYLGTADGKIYYTDETADITKDTVWSVAENTSNAEEEIVAFTEGKNGTAIALSKTNVFLIQNNAYKSITEYSEIGTPELVGKSDIFEGVKLLGGAYSAENGYVVYGNNSENKGKIYHSADGINWSLVSTSANTFVKNKITYWENKGLFILGMGSGQAGCCNYSFDGKSWQYSDTIPNHGTNGSIGLGYYGNVVANGDYIYTIPGSTGSYIKTTVTVETDEETGKKKITSYSSETHTDTTTGVKGYYFNILGVSAEASPSIFMNAGYGVAYVHNTAENTEKGAFSFINGGSGTVFNKLKWDSTINEFVGVRTDKDGFYTVDKALSNKLSTAKIENAKLTSFDNNGTKYVFGATDGSLVSLNSSDIETATAFNTIAPKADANTFEVKDVVSGGDGEFIAVVSDGTDSDILVVSADCSQYAKASESVELVLANGKKAVVKVPAVNNNDTPIDEGTMIVAIYNGDMLVQIETEAVTIPANFNDKLTKKIEFNSSVNSESKMKVFIWDSLSGMTPVCEATPFFE